MCVYQMPSAQYTKQQREQLESVLRTQLKPTCGTR
jgi:hypothetical protein